MYLSSWRILLYRTSLHDLLAQQSTVWTKITRLPHRKTKEKEAMRKPTPVPQSFILRKLIQGTSGHMIRSQGVFHDVSKCMAVELNSVECDRQVHSCYLQLKVWSETAAREVMHFLRLLFICETLFRKLYNSPERCRRPQAPFRRLCPIRIITGTIRYSLQVPSVILTSINWLNYITTTRYRTKAAVSLASASSADHRNLLDVRRLCATIC